MGKKEVDANDPMEIVGVSLPGGDLEQMAECLVEEFVRMGYSDNAILKLFRNPFYASVHHIYQRKGEDYVVKLIDKTREKWGNYVFLPTKTVEDPEL